MEGVGYGTVLLLAYEESHDRPGYTLFSTTTCLLSDSLFLVLKTVSSCYPEGSKVSASLTVLVLPVVS